jgi:hypothetical protein
MATEPAECREYAKRCLRLAVTGRPDIKPRFLALAEKWRLADHLERKAQTHGPRISR